MSGPADARAGTELRRAIADALLDMVRDSFDAADPRRADMDPLALSSDVTVNAIRLLIGATVARVPPGDDRQRLKGLIVSGLGQPIGQLLGALEPHQVFAALEGQRELAALAMSPEGPNPFSTPEAPASHLKVVK